MLRLRLLRSPLSTEQKLRIVAEYNRLSSNDISLGHFGRWTEQSPAGPAVHALLETDEALVVGHCCVLPIPMQRAGQRLTAGKAEYLFLAPEFRNQPVSGFENSTKPAVVLLLEQLYRFCSTLGWAAILSSAPKSVQVVHRMAGCQPLDFALHECLFILKPRRAARLTPGLSPQKRAMLFLAGAGQRAIAPILTAGFAASQKVTTVPIESPALEADEECLKRISFSWSPEFLRWHYCESEYLRLEVGQPSQGSLIAKTESEAGYFRVCQTQIKAPSQIRGLARELIRLAKVRNATGVRCSVYGNSERSRQVLSEMRKLGFVCVPRTRNLMVYSTESEFTRPENWAFCDSFFTFDY